MKSFVRLTNAPSLTSMVTPASMLSATRLVFVVRALTPFGEMFR